MAQVKLVLNNRPYIISCDDGQEARVNEIGAMMDAKLREIAGAGIPLTEAHQLVLLGLLVGDTNIELEAAKADLQKQNRQLQREIEQLRTQLENNSAAAAPMPAVAAPVLAQPANDEDMRQMHEMLGQLTSRVGQIVTRLKSL